MWDMTPRFGVYISWRFESLWFIHFESRAVQGKLGTAHLVKQPHLIFRNCTPKDITSPDIQELHTQSHNLT
jgi:hypothetical protein